ncbi:LOW QUALITY PROTEIN: hypothetical protein CFOL_v3_08732, partial [Cephalotus follicularis]
IEVAYSNVSIALSQRKYTLDILGDVGLRDSKPVDTPMDPCVKLDNEQGDLLYDFEKYRRLVGKLNYLTITRIDISFAVRVVSQFMHDPRASHLEAVYRIMRYLKSASSRGILFSNNGHLRLEAFTDTDWAGSRDDRRSTSGYCTFLKGNLVTWRSKKQSVVARSNAEAEYRAMVQGVCELLLRLLLKDLGIIHEKSMSLYFDNKAAINITHNPIQHDRTKHIEIDRHLIKEKLDHKLICTPFVSSENQLADIFTKGLNCKQFNCIVCKLGMRNIYA